MRLLATVLILLVSSGAYAQEKLNPVSAPTSPAAYILGVQPSAVLSPKSYQALETALYSNFLNGNGKAVIPNDVGLEFTPYWTKNHSLSLEEYLYPKDIEDQIARTSSFSLASTQNFILGDSTPTNGLAFGYRTRLYFSGKTDRAQIENYRQSLNMGQTIKAKILLQVDDIITDSTITNKFDFLTRIRDIVVGAIYKVQGEKSMQKAEELTNTIYEAANGLQSLDPKNPDPFLDAFYRLIGSTLQTDAVFENFESYIKDRQGLSMDIAYALLLNFPTNNFKVSASPRQSFWLTPTYQFKDKLSFLKILGVFRYEWYDTEYYKHYFPNSKIYSNNTDYGLALSGEWNNLSIQFETVGRRSDSQIPAGEDANGNKLFIKDGRSDTQYIGSFSYRLTKQIALTYSLGNRFEPVLNPASTLVSLLSLNFGFGAPTKDILQ